jgi:hypothetical protein
VTGGREKLTRMQLDILYSIHYITSVYIKEDERQEVRIKHCLKNMKERGSILRANYGRKHDDIKTDLREVLWQYSPVSNPRYTLLYTYPHGYKISGYGKVRFVFS